LTPIFITGIGTGIGKTLVSAIVTEALQADYWKPIQAGFSEGTDALQVASLISNEQTSIHPEVYKLQLPASPHIAAKEENIEIDIKKIYQSFHHISTKNKYIVIEGAGGLMVPINRNEFIADIINVLNAKVILVSRNYLGSINHSLLTAMACQQKGIDVLGWIFNDQYLNYEGEVVKWSGMPSLASIPFAENLNKEFIQLQAQKLTANLTQYV
jgi:dethiobiotin synthetase